MHIKQLQFTNIKAKLNLYSRALENLTLLCEIMSIGHCFTELVMFFKLIVHFRYDFNNNLLFLSCIGVMVKSGEVFPANFPDKGPEQPLRLARLFTGLQPVCINTYYINITVL